MLRATVSGSFHRYMPTIYAAVGELRCLGVEVLSPADPRVVDHIGEFLFVASDRLRSIKLVQDRHFEAIRQSDFLWVVCPDGYTGASTSAEIGAAYVSRVPVFSDHLPLDITLQHYVRKAPSIRAVVSAMRQTRQIGREHAGHFLVEPERVIESSISALERLKPTLRGLGAATDAEREVANTRRVLRESFGLDRTP